jgi:hypothetical protein
MTSHGQTLQDENDLALASTNAQSLLRQRLLREQLKRLEGECPSAEAGRQAGRYSKSKKDTQLER